MKYFYFAEDGSYGDAMNLVTIQEDDLTQEEWDIVVEMSDDERYKFVKDLISSRALQYFDDIF